ncbi:MAG: hypothetical protein PHU12_00430 [Candidatus Aenigmarchaeota archaeon]|nr:hypothetical protein [Candidatus Aenigmarchaeota archaeon]
MKIFDIFKKFKKKEETGPVKDYSGLPDELERFKIKRYPEMPPEPNYPSVPEPVFREVPKEMQPAAPEVPKDMDKMDFVLQKLETIDTRLKLIEEKLSK